MWIAVDQVGINGAALVWLLRMIVDTAFLFIFSYKLNPTYIKFKFNLLHMVFLAVCPVLQIFIHDISFKILYVISVLITFSYFSWKYFLREDERIFLISRLRTFKS